MKKKPEIPEILKELKPGSTVSTILRHVSRSGMARDISVILKDEKGEPYDASWAVAKALGKRFHRDNGGVRVSGCGMDMGFHLVYSLSYALFPEGFGCIGEGCPSNDHSNGDRDYTPHNQATCWKCGYVWPCLVRESAGEYRAEIVATHTAEGETVIHWHKDGGFAIRQRWL